MPQRSNVLLILSDPHNAKVLSGKISPDRVRESKARHPNYI